MSSIKSDEKWTSRVLPSNRDDIVNSLNYEGIAVIELQFYHFLTVTDCVQLCHGLNSLNDWQLWWSVNRKSLHIIIVLLPTPQLLWMLPETPYVLYGHENYNIEAAHRNGAIKHIFYTNQIHGGIIMNCSLFILSLHALALHLAVKNITLNLSGKRFWARWLIHTSVELYFPLRRMPAGPHFVPRGNTIKWKHSKGDAVINKTQKSRPVKTIKR